MQPVGFAWPRASRRVGGRRLPEAGEAGEGAARLRGGRSRRARVTSARMSPPSAQRLPGTRSSSAVLQQPSGSPARGGSCLSSPSSARWGRLAGRGRAGRSAPARPALARGAGLLRRERGTAEERPLLGTTVAGIRRWVKLSCCC